MLSSSSLACAYPETQLRDERSDDVALNGRKRMSERSTNARVEKFGKFLVCHSLIFFVE